MRRFKELRDRVTIGWARWVEEKERGQTLVEYGLILALVSIALLAALDLLGDRIETVFHNIAHAL